MQQDLTTILGVEKEKIDEETRKAMFDKVFDKQR